MRATPLGEFRVSLETSLTAIEVPARNPNHKTEVPGISHCAPPPQLFEPRFIRGSPSLADVYVRSSQAIVFAPKVDGFSILKQKGRF